MENLVHDSMHEIGRQMLEQSLNSIPPVEAQCCEHGHPCRSAGIRSKRLLTVLGPLQLHRSYYYEAACHRGSSPLDGVLDIEGTMYSPGVRNMMSYVGATLSYREGAENLQRLAALTIPAKSIERLAALVGPQVDEFRRTRAAGSDLRDLLRQGGKKTLYIEYDGTGVPVLKRETTGRKGKGPDGVAKTREIKLGCVFTQTTINDDGDPIRDEVSTSYFGACESAKEFQWRLLHEAQVRGIDQANRVCVIGDGAPWIWTIAEEHFPNAWQIVDLYHAREHYGTVAKMVLPEDSDELRQWIEQRKKELDDGDVSAVTAAISQLPSRNLRVRAAIENTVLYFQKNSARMRYNVFREHGLFVGSGVIEAGCKTVVGKRLKQSGMHWTIDSANNVLNLRCLALSDLWDDFWEHRMAA